MTKILGRVVLVVIPILFIIFLVRIGYLGYSGGTYYLVWDSDHQYVTDIVIQKGDGFLFWDDLYEWFNSFPKFDGFFTDMGNFMATSFNAMATTEVTDWFSFWDAVGKFFQGVAGVLGCLGYIISWPVQVVIWIAQVFFTPK